MLATRHRYGARYTSMARTLCFWILKNIAPLYIQKFHEICKHIGVAYTRIYIQQQCHIIGIRAALRNILIVLASENKVCSHRWATCRTLLSRKRSQPVNWLELPWTVCHPSPRCRSEDLYLIFTCLSKK